MRLVLIVLAVVAALGGMLVLLAALWWARSDLVMVSGAQRVESGLPPGRVQGVLPREMAKEIPPPASTARTSPVAVEKGEDEYSQAVAARAVGMLRAMVRALSQALVEEEKALAAKKGAAKPPAAPPKTSPDWVEAPPRPLHGAYQMSIAVGPYTTRAECDAKLPDALQEALDHYAEVCLGGQVEEPVLLPPDQLRQLVKDQWEEVRQYSVGPMVRLHVLLQFDGKVKDRVDEENKRGVVARRLRLTGIGLAAGLALLGAFYGYLKATGTRDGG